MSSIYMDVTSESSTYPGNKANNFRIDLHPILELFGDYECSLEELLIPELVKPIKALYITSNFTSLQNVNGVRRPVLRVVINPEKHNRLGSQYRGIDSKKLSTLEFRFEDSKGELVQFKTGITVLTLHFHGFRTKTPQS